MSTLFMKCTLEDPSGGIDVSVIGYNEFELEGNTYKICGVKIKKEAEDKAEYHVKLKFDSDPNKSLDVISVLLTKCSKEVSEDVLLGYIRNTDVKYLMPFYNHYQGKVNNNLETTICRLNPQAYGANGITIRVGLKQRGWVKKVIQTLKSK